MNTISRKEFFKKIFISLTVPLTWIWYYTVKKTNEIYSENEKTIIAGDIPNGISFHDKFIIVKTSSSLNIYSSKCTHLGCLIKNKEGNEFVCPCHGSRYDLTGQALKGPAQKPLRLLRFKKEKDKIIIYES